jgi:integrase
VITVSFLEQFAVATTRKTYTSILSSFFRFLGTAEPAYRPGSEQFQSDAERFIDSLQGKAPKTISLAMTILRQWGNNTKLDTSFFVVLKRRKGRAYVLTADRIPTKEELKQILTRLPPLSRLLLLFMATSGARISEALHVTKADITFGSPTVVILRHTKGNKPRKVFITSELTNQMRTWVGALHDSDAIFPMSNSLFLHYWWGALDAGKIGERDPKSKRRTLHPHCLRKWFNTNLTLSGMQQEFRDALLSHGDAYMRLPVEAMAPAYLKAESLLTVGVDEK